MNTANNDTDDDIEFELDGQMYRIIDSDKNKLFVHQLEILDDLLQIITCISKCYHLLVIDLILKK